MKKYDNTAGLILAGGRAQRMGGQDKGLLQLNGHAMIEYVIAGLNRQVCALTINANRNIHAYQQFGYPVIADQLADFQGPLAGMVSAMQDCQHEYMVIAPCDGPFIRDDYVARLHAARARTGSNISVAHDGQRLQPVYTLLASSLCPSLLAYLATGNRKIDLWYQQEGYCVADFADATELFVNINTPQELATASKKIGPINVD